MRTYLTGPRWPFGVVAGVVLAVFSLLMARLTGTPMRWSIALPVSLLCGLLGGALIFLTLGRQRRLVREAVGDLPPDELTAAYRAAGTGPVPSDPRVRAAAVRLARSRADATRRGRPLLVGAVMLLAGSAVAQVLNDRYLLAALNAAAAVLLAGQLWQLKRLPRRIEELSG